MENPKLTRAINKSTNVSNRSNGDVDSESWEKSELREIFRYNMIYCFDWALECVIFIGITATIPLSSATQYQYYAVVFLSTCMLAFGLVGLVNVWYGTLIEKGREDEVREWCRSKVGTYFLKLHGTYYRTREHEYLPKFHVSNTSNGGVERSELWEIFLDNMLRCFACAFVCMIFIGITGSAPLSSVTQHYAMNFFAVCMFIFGPIGFVNAWYGVLIEKGHEDQVREWCRSKIGTYFLMLHGTYYRTRQVLDGF